MGDQRFIVFPGDGTTQPIIAESGVEDDEPDGYVLFVDSKGGVAGLFHKGIVQSWREDPGGTAGEASV
jgi:hypothetical protein